MTLSNSRVSFVNKCLLALTVTTIGLMTACHKKQANYFPISANSEWICAYKHERTGVPTQNGTLTTRVAGTASASGKTYYKLVTRLTGIGDDSEVIDYYRSAPDGTFGLASDYKVRGEQLYRPADLTVGRSWSYGESSGAFNYRVEGAETIEAGGTKYPDCVKISFSGTLRRFGATTIRVTGVLYVADGIGTVKTTREETSSNTKSVETAELISYKN